MKPIGRPIRGIIVAKGHNPTAKSSLSIPANVPKMTAKKAMMLTPTIPTTIEASIFSARLGGGGLGVFTTPGYRLIQRGILVMYSASRIKENHHAHRQGQIL